jgi:hypothetical protein
MLDNIAAVYQTAGGKETMRLQKRSTECMLVRTCNAYAHTYIFTYLYIHIHSFAFSKFFEFLKKGNYGENV